MFGTCILGTMTVSVLRAAEEKSFETRNAVKLVRSSSARWGIASAAAAWKLLLLR